MSKVAYPTTKQERTKLYLHCMLEIKERFAAAETLLQSSMLPLFKQETCYLQLRHICELIAIACLAAQGDFKTQRAFTEEYSPAKIFNALRRIYPHCFPQPAEIRSEPGIHHLTASNRPGAYTEAQVVDLWNRAGSHLHRASVKKYLSTTFRQQPNLDEVIGHLNGLLKLLDSHVVPINFQESGPSPVLLHVIMEDGKGRVEAHYLNMELDAGTMTIETYHAEVGPS